MDLLDTRLTFPHLGHRRLSRTQSFVMTGNEVNGALQDTWLFMALASQLLLGSCTS
jgi:hypothetical protein